MIYKAEMGIWYANVLYGWLLPISEYLHTDRRDDPRSLGCHPIESHGFDYGFPVLAKFGKTIMNI